MKSANEVAVIVQARLSSERCPQKMIRPFADKTLTQITCEKILKSKVLIIGMGGLGCPVAEFLTRAGIGVLGIIDSDRVELSNIHRQSLYNIEDLKKIKVFVAKKIAKN